MRKRYSNCFSAVVILAGAAAVSACSSNDKTPSGTAPAASGASDSRGLARPVWATSNSLVGVADPAATYTVQIFLKMRNEAQAEAQLAAISAPLDPQFRHYLSDAEFDALYAPTDADVAAISAQLESSGLRVTYVPTNRAFVGAEGTGSAVEKMFSTKLGEYSVNGTTKRAPIDTPRIRGAVADRVLAVLGLESPVIMAPHNVHVGGVSRDDVAPGTTTAGTCSEWWGSTPDATDPAFGTGYGPLALAPCGYKPAQIRTSYGFDDSVRKGNDGTGVSVAIVDAYMSPTLLQDAQTYAANEDPDYPLATSQFSSQWAPGTVTKAQTGWYGEQTLDVEAVHAIAPGANIVFVGAQSASDQDLTAAINLVISKRLATIISNSYGSPEAGPNDFVIWHAIANEAGLKGIGLYFSSGDDGDETINLGAGNPSADFPASLDNATAVGGTSLALGQTGGRVFELGWETGVSHLLPPQVDGGASDGGGTTATVDAGSDAGPLSWQPAAPGSFKFGSGGGTSYVYEQPAWQASVVPFALANIPGASARVVPDVAMLADPVTGYLIGQTSPRSSIYKESVIGGTSLACPLFAGTMALAEQKTGKPIGFASPTLYAAYSKKAFVDVVPSTSPLAVAVQPGYVATFDYPGLAIQTATGYDNVTGMGVPNGKTFLTAVSGR